jgi:hypothetical protein
MQSCLPSSLQAWLCSGLPLSTCYFLGLSMSPSSILANRPRTLGWLSARAFLQAYCDRELKTFYYLLILHFANLNCVKNRMFAYLDLSAKVSLDLLLPVPGELLLPFLCFQVTDGHKPLNIS